ncbi:unnamed protein product [Calypogeia fissa]
MGSNCFVNWPPSSLNILYRKDIDKLFDQVFTIPKDWNLRIVEFETVKLGPIGPAEFYIKRTSAGEAVHIPKNFVEAKIGSLRDKCCPKDNLVEGKCPHPGGASWPKADLGGIHGAVTAEIGIQPSRKD